MFASLSLNGRCNSRCSYCWSWKSPVQGPTTAEWLNVIDQIADLGVQHLNLSGGEPLLRADLPVLIAHAKKHKLIVQLSTNGLLLKKDRFVQAVTAGLDYVTVSLDTLNPDRFIQLRGVPLNVVLEGIEAAIQLHQIHPGLQVGLKCVISHLNLHDVFELIDWAVAKKLYLGFQPFHAQFISDPQVTSHLSFLEDDLPNLEETMQGIMARKQETEIIVNQIPYLSHFSQFLVYGNVPPNFSCRAGEETVNIDTNLNLKPCWMFSSVGSLTNHSLITLWMSPKFEVIRPKMRLLECTHCWLTCHTDQI